MTYNNLGTKIRFVRAKVRDYTQEYMAQKLNISQNTYSKIENGQIKITLDRLEEISQILEIPVEDLLRVNEHIILNNCINSAAIVNGDMINNETKKIYEIFQKSISHIEDQLNKQFELIKNRIDRLESPKH